MTTSSALPFGARLRRLRLAAGLTQEGLAERAGLSARGVQDLERGINVSPRAETLRLLSEALGLDAAQRAELIAAARPELAANVATGAVVLRPAPLPTPPTALIGRERDLATACALLRPGGQPEATRLLTMTGPGGVGKTRLAVAVADALATDFDHQVAWVDLAPLDEPSLVPTAIAHALGMKEQPDRSPIDMLKAALADRTLLLVLDNLEHLLPAGPLIADLLAAAPHVTVLATSRARLRLRGERELPVAPLALPDSSDDLSTQRMADVPAVRLFVECASDVSPGFTLQPDTIATVVEICRRVDGLPLAVELAASWVRMIPPAELLDRLERRLPLLTGGARDLPARQQTMRDTIDWSLGLLSPEEQLVFRRLAVFVGGFTLDAAEAVVCGTGVGLETHATPASVLTAIAALGDHSILRPVEQKSSPRAAASASTTRSEHASSRFSMLETVREAALERLEDSEEESAVRRAYATFYLELVERAESELGGPDQALWLSRLDEESANLRAVLEWCSTPAGDVETGLRLVDGLWSFWEMRGRLREGRRWLESMLSKAPERTAMRARVLTGAGALAFDQGDYHAARAFHDEALSIRRELDDSRGTAVSLGNLGSVAQHQGKYAEARVLHEECLAIMRGLDEQQSVSIALNNLGQTALRQGDFKAACGFHQESREISRRLGDDWSVAISLNNLGEAALSEEDYQSARDQFEEALAVMQELGDTRIIAVVLNNLGEVALCRRDYDTARGLFEDSIALAREVDDWLGIATALANLGIVALERGDVAAARELLTESLRKRHAMDDQPGVARCLVVVAGILAADSQPERAARFVGAADALMEAIGAVMAPADRAVAERTLTGLRQSLGEERFAAERAAGATLSVEHAIAEALTLAIQAA